MYAVTAEYTACTLIPNSRAISFVETFDALSTRRRSILSSVQKEVRPFVKTLLTGPTVGASHRVSVVFCDPDIFFSITIQSLKISLPISISAYPMALKDG